MTRPRDQDGGWAWIVLGACSVCLMVTSGLAALAGMFQSVFLEEFGGGLILTTWITSLYASLMQLMGPVCGAVCSVFGCRTSVMAGGLLLTSGLLMSSFSHDLIGLLFAFGISSGFGLGLIYSAAIVKVNLSFVRFRPLATGSVLAAGGVGVMVMPVVCRFLLSSYSCRQTLLLLAAMSAQLLVAGALLYEDLGVPKASSSSSAAAAVARNRSGCSYCCRICLPSPNGGKRTSTRKAGSSCKTTSTTLNSSLNVASATEETNFMSSASPSDRDSVQTNNVDDSAGQHSRNPVPVSRAECRSLMTEELAVGVETRSLSGLDSEQPVQDDTADVLHTDPYTDNNTTSLVLQSDLLTEYDTMGIVPCSDPSTEDAAKYTAFCPGLATEDITADVEAAVLMVPEESSAEVQSSKADGPVPAKTFWNNVRCVLTSPSILVICLQLFLSSAAVGIVLVHFVTFCLQMGSDFDDVSLSFSANGLALTVSRFLIGALMQDRDLDPLSVYVGMALVTSLIMVLTPVVAVSVSSQISIMAVLGLYGGSSYVLITEITIRCAGVDTLSLAFGLQMVSAGLGYLVAPPVAGWLVVWTNSYGNALFLAGCLHFISAFVAMVLSVTRPKWTPGQPSFSEKDVSPSDDETMTS